ncbi:MAG: Nuclease SbcCD subunit D [Syntrophorhabdus sp. PtaU1.Bin002]|nr:MAG: Nuclease SbcCD subunit D [Syntrophorhabdus sp. PtaU1.Bin002]
MKILHTADIHMNNKPQLLADIVKCCDYLITQVEERPDLIVIAGDLYDEGVQLGSPASLAAINFVYRCGNVAPTIIIRGTTSHDAEGSISVLNILKTIYPVFATDWIEQVALINQYGNLGFALLDSNETIPPPIAIISTLPSVNKANLMATLSGSVADTSRETIDLVRDVLQGWGVVNERARHAGIPTILVGHGTVTGSQLSTGQTMAGKDLEYTTGDLKLAAADLNLLGHIHKAQSWGNTFYSGSITRLNYGETEEKGFYIHEIKYNVMPTGHVPFLAESRFIETPARTMKTKQPEGLPGIEVVDDVQQGELVRICYEINEEDVGKVDEQAIIEAAMAKGAADVKIEKTIIPTVRVRAEGISRLHTLEQKLLKWAETTDTSITKEIAEKLALLESNEIEDIVSTYKEDANEADQAAA